MVNWRRSRNHRRSTTHYRPTSEIGIDLATLDEEIARNHSQVSALLSEKTRREATRAELYAIRERVRENGKVIKLFGIVTRLSDHAQIQIATIDAKLAELDKAPAPLAERWSSLSGAIRALEGDWQSLVWRKQVLERQFISAKRVEDTAKHVFERAKRARADAALIARAKGTTRAEAARLVKSLSRDHPCPYCGQPLGTSAQADHIHPVAKGGLSIAANMVYACQPCNSKKRDKTLNDFIEQAGLDHRVVRQRLKTQAKDC